MNRNTDMGISSFKLLKKIKGKDKIKSVVFLHNAYYNFYYLAKELRKRGWNALTVSVDPLTNPDYQFYHGEDLNLWKPNKDEFYKNIDKFVHRVKKEFKMIHFYGMGRMSFYPDYWDNDSTWSAFPFDFVDLKRHGLKIGYSHSGCLDMVSQSSFYKWSGGACNKCIYQNNINICSDIRNLSWGHKVQLFCDLICIETDPVIDYKSGPKVYREPLTFAIDQNIWKENLEIPKHLQIQKKPGEILIYHAVGNYKSRSTNSRNIKGTPFITEAINNLKKKGFNVSLQFVTDVPSTDVRFIQSQCDIIVDQLNYGRYGATAREAMMLGKPVVCNINAQEYIPGTESKCITESPLISSTEQTIEKTLEDLIVNSEKRAQIGKKSREHAIKWWSAESCAERFEEVYDRLLLNQPISELPFNLHP